MWQFTCHTSCKILFAVSMNVKELDVVELDTLGPPLFCTNLDNDLAKQLIIHMQQETMNVEYCVWEFN